MYTTWYDPSQAGCGAIWGHRPPKPVCQHDYAATEQVLLALLLLTLLRLARDLN
jgi:hypothetical protein